MEPYAAAVTALATLAIVVLTFRNVRLNGRLLAEARKQRAPLMSLHVTPDEKRFGLLHVVIENVGRSGAYAARFSVHAARPSPISAKLEAFGPVKNGIRYIAPGQRFTSFIGSVMDLGPKWHTIAVDVDCNYEDADGEPHQSSCPIDLSMYERLEAVGPTDQLKKLATAAESIARTLAAR